MDQMNYKLNTILNLMEKDEKQSLPFKLYKGYFLIKTLKSFNKVEIVNAIRAIKNVVTVEVDHKNDGRFYKEDANSQYEKSLLRIKFITSSWSQPPEEAANELKQLALGLKEGESKIKGLDKFEPINRTLQITKY